MIRWPFSARSDRAFKLPPRHVRAWYCYAFAAEVFAACAMAIFLPITLEHMARDVGFVSPELLRPCSEVIAGSSEDELLVCKARIMGVWIDTASFSMYVKSVAVALQALCIISVGPLADSPYWRKQLLVTFALLGAISGILFLALPSSSSSSGLVPLFAALLTIVGNIAYAVANVCSNAFLPTLAKEDEAVRAARKSMSVAHDGHERDDAGVDDGPIVAARSSLERVISSISTAELAHPPSPPPSPHSHYDALLSSTTSRLSSIGTAIGFFSGVSVLALLLIPVMTFQGSTAGLKVAIALSGLWWGIFLIPASLGLPGGEKEREVGGTRIGWIGQGWKRVGRMVRLKEIRAIPNLYMFLLAWIFLSDGMTSPRIQIIPLTISGFHTTTYVAILYASSTLHLSSAKVILIGILVQLTAVISSVVAPRIQNRLRYGNLQLLLGIVLLAEALPLYACLGLILPWGGLRSEGEMYVAAVWFGMLYGPFNSYSRAVFAELIPPGHESSFFSLFALTDKSASFLGPLIVGIIADLTGNIRLGFLFLLIMLAVPIPVLIRVDMTRGREEARTWAERKQGEETEGLLQAEEG
ncbi:autophagy-related protein 22-like protein [Dioszegia hungarica]|uniref:Autophagy-related protein n=1 Tax=Dioszegia hungarica TaxID=4972 RepID=A0AA38HAG8_9TREE|nr:autophagy-related protein 22-like protein [Dioszegia hungarica]KAI9636802.1 autophagy-related protein 22-like protein [Dioszegia hungarica]